MTYEQWTEEGDKNCWYTNRARADLGCPSRPHLVVAPSIPGPGDQGRSDLTRYWLEGHTPSAQARRFSEPVGWAPDLDGPSNAVRLR